MTVSIALVTHDEIGQAMLNAARRILDRPLSSVVIISVPADKPPEVEALRQRLAEADQGHGVLVMTDMKGSTPYNLAVKAGHDNYCVLSGLNLAMLIRAWSYRQRTLENVAKLAAEGGRAAITESS